MWRGLTAMLLGMLQMENAAAAAYATNPQLPPSLVVFSQAGDTLSDVLTMQRTFNHQVCDLQSITAFFDQESPNLNSGH
jgi:hypothetical protein